MVAGLIAAVFVPIGYYVISPGGWLDVPPTITVEGTADYPVDGQIDLLTVSERKATALLALIGWLDPSSSVYEEEVIRPTDIPADELRAYNQSLFVNSTEKAVGVATEYLGYDSISGTGATVAEVVADTPAASTLVVGDTIVAIDGMAVATDSDAVSTLGQFGPGETVTLTISPEAGGDDRPVVVTLAENPRDPSRAYLGVGLVTRDLAIDPPFDVAIDVDGIGGPSAGLAMTLSVIDRLTPGQLTGGRHVAVTGTIELDGSVGPVGGIEQKAKVVEDSGAVLFLVPSESYDQAQEALGDDVVVKPVDTLADALVALEEFGGDPVTAVSSG